MRKTTVMIDSEALDGIIRQTLVEDYRGLCEEVRRLENKRPLKDFELEDLQSSRQWRDGLEKLLSYYLMEKEAREVIDAEYIKSEYSYSEDAADVFAEDIDEDQDDVEYHKDLKEKRIQMLEEQVEYLMGIATKKETFAMGTDRFGRRYTENEKGVRTYLDPFEYY